MRTLSHILGLLGLCGVAAGAPLAVAAVSDQEALEYVARQGCAIGPDTAAQAAAEGVAPEAVEALHARALGAEGSLRTGQWLVLPSGVCRIHPPRLAAAAGPSETELKAHLSAPDAWADEGMPGCFLNSATLGNYLAASRGWDEVQRDREITLFLAGAVIDGTLAFYSNDILVTPPGFILMTGDCEGPPNLDVIRREHAALIQHFNTIIRAQAATMTCGERGSYISPGLLETATEASGVAFTNAWLGFQIDLIVTAAGWTEGSARLGQGTLRPPFCQDG